MRRKWIALWGICALLTGLVFAEEEEIKQFSGTVTGPDDNPVVGAQADLYLLSIDQPSMSYRIYPMGQSESDAEGHFSFSVNSEDVKAYTSSHAIFCCLVQKEGLSCGWATLMSDDQALDVQLTEPQKMIGFVYTADGKPVPEAEVRLVAVMLGGDGQQFMFGVEPVEAFATKTCEDGRFDFTNLPENATAEFLVRKPGMGTLCTLNTGMNPSEGLTYKAGQTDIRLTMQDGLTLAGKVVIQDGRQPAEGIPVVVIDSQMPVNLISKPQETAADGSFEFTDLASGNYQVSIQDDDWIAEPLSVPLGQDVTDVVLELVTGGTLEVKVVDSATEEPIAGAQVQLRSEEIGRYLAISADEKGIARKQLFAGTYQVGAYAQGYRFVNNTSTVAVENDKTATITVQLGGQSKIAGTVLGPDGKPFEGAVIRMIPDSGTQRDGVKSDEKGQFKIAWDPERVSWADGEFYLLAFSEEKNLAGAELIGPDIEEATVKLQEGVKLTGKVLNAESEPISNARVYLNFRGSRYGASFGRDIKTDDSGQYTFVALAPEYRYSVNVTQAEGYGTDSRDVELLSGTTPVEDIVLQVADRKVSGQVVDADGEGLANVRLHCHGDGQPNLNIQSDEEGKFVFENVCAGEIRISANYQKTGEYMYGNVETEGGAEDVRLVLTSQGSHRYVPKTPPSLVGKVLPELTDCGLTVPADANAILVFAWDMNQRPSRHFLKQLAAKADLLNENNVTVLLLNTAAVEKANLDAWLSESGIEYPCGIISDNAEEKTFSMGVKSLPWLILTDNEHNVIAEGFSVDELDEKVKDL